MLFVTVSVLQLREVVHPDLLSLIIRPQEPHPDLLGSLLQESGQTHARRIAMSLVSMPMHVRREVGAIKTTEGGWGVGC